MIEPVHFYQSSPDQETDLSIFIDHITKDRKKKNSAENLKLQFTHLDRTVKLKAFNHNSLYTWMQNMEDYMMQRQHLMSPLNFDLFYNDFHSYNRICRLLQQKIAICLSPFAESTSLNRIVNLIRKDLTLLAKNAKPIERLFIQKKLRRAFFWSHGYFHCIDTKKYLPDVPRKKKVYLYKKIKYRYNKLRKILLHMISDIEYDLFCSPHV